MERERQPYLIIVTGRPASGKSTLAHWLAEELQLPVVGKDHIREVLFDRLGWRDREWARLLGRAAIDLMFYFARQELAAGRSVIMDNAFGPKASAPRFRDFLDQANAGCIQIVCDAESDILWQRFQERAARGGRHPGHGDRDVLEELRWHLAEERPAVMDIGGELVELDTSDIDALNHADILAEVRAIMGQGGR